MSAAHPSGRGVLRESVTGQRGRVALSALFGSGHQIGEALVPALIGVVIDRAVTGSDTGALVLWLGVLAAVYAGLALSFRIGAWSGELAAVRAEPGTQPHHHPHLNGGRPTDLVDQLWRRGHATVIQ